jgi:histone deacetylase complex regulatory component SIN3
MQSSETCSNPNLSKSNSSKHAVNNWEEEISTREQCEGQGHRWRNWEEEERLEEERIIKRGDF